MAGAGGCGGGGSGEASPQWSQSGGTAADCSGTAGTFHHLLEQLYADLDATIQKRHAELRDHIDAGIARQEAAIQELSEKCAPSGKGAFLHLEPQRCPPEPPADHPEAGPAERPEWTSGAAHGSSSGLVGNPSTTFRIDEEKRRGAALAASSLEELLGSGSGPVPLGWHAYLQMKARGAVESPCFDSMSALLIISNAIVLGAQIEYSASQSAASGVDAWDVVQYTYCIVFLCELLLRMLALGRSFFRGPEVGWNYADLVIVAVSVFEMIIKLSDSSSGLLMNMMVVRMIRMFRIVRVTRVLRLFRFFRSLRLLAQSIFVTLKSLVWAMLLLLIILYMFGIVFTQVAMDHLSESSDPVLSHYYGGLPKSMFTLFKSISGGVNWEEVVNPLSRIGGLYVVLFVFYIVLTMFAVLNVMTGHFCQSAIETAENDQNDVVQAQLACKEVYTKRLRDLFLDLDEGSGAFTLETFEAHMQDARMKAYFETLEIDVSDAWTLFKLLDAGGNHIIDATSFVEGCMRLRGIAKALGMKELMYETRWMNDTLTKFVEYANSQFYALADADRRIVECTSTLASTLAGLTSRPPSPIERL